MAFSQYRGQTIGRALFFLYAIHSDFDNATFSNGKVYLNNKLACTYTWKEGTDEPIFTFHNDYEDWNGKQFVKDSMELASLWVAPEKVCHKHPHNLIVKNGMCSTCIQDLQFKENLAKAYHESL